MRKRGIKQLEDARNSGRKFTLATSTEEGRKISKSAKDQLLYYYLLEIDDEKTNIRVQEARAKVNLVTSKSIELGAKIRTFGKDLASQFHEEHESLFLTTRLTQVKIAEITEENEVLRGKVTGLQNQVGKL